MLQALIFFFFLPLFPWCYFILLLYLFIFHYSLLIQLPSRDFTCNECVCLLGGLPCESTESIYLRRRIAKGDDKKSEVKDEKADWKVALEEKTKINSAVHLITHMRPFTISIHDMSENNIHAICSSHWVQNKINKKSVWIKIVWMDLRWWYWKHFLDVVDLFKFYLRCWMQTYK